MFLLFVPVEVKPQSGECAPSSLLSVLVPCRDSVTLDPALVVFGLSCELCCPATIWRLW